MPKPASKSSKVATTKSAKSPAPKVAKVGAKVKTPVRPAKSEPKKHDAKHPEVKAEKKPVEAKKADAKKVEAKTAKPAAESKKPAKAAVVEVKKAPVKADKGAKATEKPDAKAHDKHHDAKHDAKAHDAKHHDAKHAEAKSHGEKAHDSKPRGDAKHADSKHDAKHAEAKHVDATSKSAAVKADAAAEEAKGGRKGITIVTPKPVKKMPPKPVTPGPVPTNLGRLMDPSKPPRRPLIPSGPKAAATRPLGAQDGESPTQQPVKGKTPFNKKELERYRDLLIHKRAELVGDVKTMESQALQADSGALSSTPQHMAEQGSETYDQSLSLDLAAADRKLIREIDDALTRIEQGTFGICEITGKPIKHERLEELPWARYTIEAQRELERLRMRI